MIELLLALVGLLAAGGSRGGGSGGDNPGAPKKGGPKRIAVPPVENKPWSAPVSKSLEIEAPGWYADVETNRDDGPCGDDTWNGIGKVTCNDGGRWNPKPLPFSIPLVRIDTDRVVSVDVTIVDVDGIVARTEFRTRKNTSGRRRGNLDVNEYELEGSARETQYCERLSRAFGPSSAGKYLEHVQLDCETETTPRQPYTLYRAQRDVTMTKWLATIRVWEYFAKIRPGPAYAGAGIYALQLKLVGGWATLTGEVAASLAPQLLEINTTTRTRQP